MSKHTKDLFEKASRFSIRKYKVGVFSVLIGSLFLGIVTTSDTAFAASESAEEISQQVSGGISETRTVSPILETTSQTASESVSIENKGEDRAGEAATGVQETVTEREIGNQTPQATDRLTVVTSSSLEKDQNYYEASKFDSDKVLEVTNVTTQNKTNKTIDLSSDLNKVKSLNSATIYMEFKPEEGQTGLYTLFSASSSTNRDSYYAVGIQNGNTPFVEARKNGVQQYGSLLRKGTINTNEWNSLAVTMNQTDTGAGRIDIYLNGQYAFHSSRSGKFISDFTDLTHMQLGAMRRGTSMTWGANVNFRNFTIYDRALSATEVAERSKIFDKLPSDVVDKDGQVLTDGEIVLNKNAYSPTAGFRIPTLLKTADGTLIAGADRRIATMADQGDMEMMVRLSQDNGKTWGDRVPIFNLRNSPSVSLANQPASMDMALVQDPATGKVFAFYDLFIEGRALRGLPTTPEKGYKMVDGKNYQRLYRNADKAEFTIRENGVVYDANNQATNYRVILTPSKGANNDYDTYGDIYEGNSRLGNIYFSTNSLFTVPNTSYILMSESSDNGKTWSAPRNISDMVRTDDMEFLGIGPGTAIVLKEGKHAGRIVVPTYSRGSVTKLESARVMYSDDHGATWKSGEAANDGRIVANGTTIQSKDFRDGSYQNSEAAVVQLKNGQLEMFMRNRSGTVQIATSNDGGATWEDSIESTKIPEETTQMSAITTIQDGKEYVILVNGGTPRRINGYAHVAEVKDNGLLEWKETHLIQKGQFAYNSIQQLSDTEFGLLYEHDGTTSGNMYYKTMNWEFLKPKEQKEIVVSVVSSSLTNQSDLIALTYDDNVIASHDLALKLSNGKNLSFVAQYDAKTLLFRWDRNTDSMAKVTGIVSGKLESLKNYTINEVATLPHNLNASFSKENIAFDTYYKGDENLDFGLERTEAGTLGKKLTNNTYYVNSQGQVIERTVISVTPPLSRVRVKGTKPTVTTISTELPLVYQADSSLAYGQTVRISGNPKIETLTTTYEVHADNGTITPTTTSVVSQEGSSPIFKIGTQPTQKTQELAFETEFVADENLAYGQSSEIAGVTGVKTITTTYKLEGDKAVVDATSDQVTTAAQNRLVKIGTKPSVVTKEIAFTTTYEADDSLALNEQQVKIAGVLGSEIMTTTYKLDGDHAVVDKVNTQIINPTVQVIKVGTRPTTQETKLESPVRYEVKADKDFGSANETVSGETGVSTVTTTYTVNPTTGEVTATAGEPVITKPATATIVYVGTKPTVITESIPFGTDYVADENLAYGKSFETAGVAGVKTITTTYKLEGDKAVVADTTEQVTTAAQNRLVKIGTKPSVETKELDFATEYVADETAVVNAQTVTTPGVKGSETTTTTYKLDGDHVVVDQTTTATKSPINQVISVGTKPTETTASVPFSTEYVADANLAFGERQEMAGQNGVETTTTTYKLENGRAVQDKVTTVQTQAPVNKQVKIGNVKVETTTTNPETVYEADTSLSYGATVVASEGKAGQTVTTTTYQVDASGNLVNGVETVTTTPAENRVIRIGNIQTSTSPIALETVYEDDPDNFTTSEIVVTAGQAGEETTTLTYQVNPATGELTNPVTSSVTNKEMVKRVIKRGTLAVVAATENELPTVEDKTSTESVDLPFTTRYEADETKNYGVREVRVSGQAGKQTTTRHTAILNGEIVAQREEVTGTTPAVEEVIVLGTKPKTETVSIASPVRYEADAAKDFGSTNETVPGQAGERTVTTTYTVNPTTGEVTATVGEALVTKEPTETIVKIGTKPTVTTATVPFSTDYVADENLAYGEQSETAGVVGENTVTTTYTVNADGTVTAHVGEPVQTKAPVTKVVKIGMKPETTTADVDYTTSYVADETLDYGKTAVRTPGVKGQATTTTTYKLDGNKAVVDQVTSSEMTAPIVEVIAVGTKPTTTTADVDYTTNYVADDTLDYGKTTVRTPGVKGQATTTTTYKLNGDHAVVDKINTQTTNPTARVISMGTKPTVQETEIASPVRYEAKYDKDFGSANETVLGETGVRTVTTTYTVNLTTGEVTATTGDPVITKPAKATVVYVGAKPTVTTESVPFGTDYVADESLAYGQSSETAGASGTKTVTKTYKLEGDQAVVDATSEEVTAPAQNRVIRVGNVQTATAPITIETVYEDDPANFTTSEIVVTEGQAGESSITTTYTVNPSTGVLENPQSHTSLVQEMKPRVIKRGTLAVVAETENELPVVEETSREEVTETPYKTIYRDDDSLYLGTNRVLVQGKNGKRVVRHNQASLNGQVVAENEEILEDISVIDEVILRGTKAVHGRETIVTYEDIEPTIVYSEDNTLLKGQTRTERGTVGKRQVTRVYETIRGIRTNTILEFSETVIKQAKPTIIYLGTKVISEVPSVAPIQPELPELDIRREKTQEEILVRFTRKEIMDSTLPSGSRKVIVAGRDGKILRTIISDYAGQELIYTNSYDEMLEEVVTEIVAVGVKEATNLTELPNKPVESAKELTTASQTQSRNRLPETGSEDSAILTNLGLLGLMSGLGLTFKKRKE